MSSLNCVYMHADVYLSCLEHALSTENEEVMGLLIGEIRNGESYISAFEMLRRMDKRKDRVEISPEQLTEATEKAEDLAKEMNKPLRIVGWYHSHPHITVFPSHVDLNTQLNYQTLDDCFVGVIFSVFRGEKAKQEIVVGCFQTIRGQNTSRPIKLRIVQNSISKPCLETMAKLPKILLTEDEELYNEATRRAGYSSLATIQNKAERTKSMCSVFGRISVPLLLSITSRLDENKRKLDMMDKEIELLKREIDSLTKEVGV